MKSKDGPEVSSISPPPTGTKIKAVDIEASPTTTIPVGQKRSSIDASLPAAEPAAKVLRKDEFALARKALKEQIVGAKNNNKLENTKSPWAKVEAIVRELGANHELVVNLDTNAALAQARKDFPKLEQHLSKVINAKYGQEWDLASAEAEGFMSHFQEIVDSLVEHHTALEDEMKEMKRACKSQKTQLNNSIRKVRDRMLAQGSCESLSRFLAKSLVQYGELPKGTEVDPNTEPARAAGLHFF